MSFSVCFAAWKRAFCVVNGMIGSYSLLSAHKRGPDTAPGARWLCVIIRQSFEMLLRATFATENCHHPCLLIFQLAISGNLSDLFLCSCIMQLTATSCCLSIVLCRKPAAWWQTFHAFSFRGTFWWNGLFSFVWAPGWNCLVVLIYLLDRNLLHPSVSGAGRSLQNHAAYNKAAPSLLAHNCVRSPQTVHATEPA